MVVIFICCPLPPANAQKLVGDGACTSDKSTAVPTEGRGFIPTDYGQGSILLLRVAGVISRESPILYLLAQQHKLTGQKKRWRAIHTTKTLQRTDLKAQVRPKSLDRRGISEGSKFWLAGRVGGQGGGQGFGFGLPQALTDLLSAPVPLGQVNGRDTRVRHPTANLSQKQKAPRGAMGGSLDMGPEN